MTIELPARIGLCPEHGEEFYYPLADGEKPTCPCCPLTMTVYKRTKDGPQVHSSPRDEVGDYAGGPSSEEPSNG